MAGSSSIAARIALGSYEYEVRSATVSLSASLREIAGAEDRALPLDAFLHLIHEDDRPGVAAATSPGPGVTPPATLCRFFQPSGSVRWTVLRAEPARDSQNQLVRVVGLVFDTSSGHDEYLSVLASMSDPSGGVIAFRDASVALLIGDADRVIDVNPAFTRLSGFDAATLGDRSNRDGWDRLCLPEVVRQIQAHGRFQDLVWRVQARDGSTHLVLVSAAPMSHRGKPAMLVAFIEATVRFETQSLLAESEERSRRLSGEMPEGLLFTEKGVILDCNERVADMLGYSVEDLRGTPLLDLVEPSQADAMRLWLSQAQPEPYVVSIRHSDGRSILFEAATRMLDRDNRKLRVTSLRDLSEKQRADLAVRALRDSQEQFRQLAEAHGEGVALKEHGRIVHANTKLASMFGRRPAEMIGRELASFARPDTRDFARRREDDEAPYVFLAQRADGSTFSAEVSPHNVNVDGRTYHVATIRDVTRRERAEQLRRALFTGTAGVTGNEFFRSLVGHLCAVFGVRSAMVAEFTGKPPSRVVAVSFWHDGMYGDPFDRPLAGTPCEQVMRRGLQCFSRDVAALFPEDAWLAALGAEAYFGAPLFDSGGEPAGVLAVLDDSTIERTDERDDTLTTFAARASVELQRLRGEQEIRKLNAELEQRVADRTAMLEAANRELEAFSYSVSHDLRAPLRHVTGFVQLLRAEAEPVLGPAGRDHLAAIGTAAGNMATLIDTLLDFSRLARTEMQSDPVDLAEMAASVIGELEKDAGGRSVQWEIGALPLVRGDRLLLHQVLVNLLSNAFKYTRPREVAHIEIGAAASSAPGEVVWFVRDNGVGFNMARASKLFGVFQRFHAASEFEGTGIGLANVQRIVARHGGRVWAESRPGEGATFFVALPAAGGDDSPVGTEL